MFRVSLRDVFFSIAIAGLITSQVCLSRDLASARAEVDRCDRDYRAVVASWARAERLARELQK